MTMQLPSSVLNVSLFGSVAREDFDDDSDLDVLVIVANGSGRTDSGLMYEYIHKKYGRTPSISWYGLRKMRKLFSSGDLFAWHLALEAKLIAGNALTDLVFKPARYSSAVIDMSELRELALRVACSIEVCPQNAVFEMGILYVCARNIGMSGSAVLNCSPSFGRYSPYDIAEISFPMERMQYELMMRCRLASQRGTEPPMVSPTLVAETQVKIVKWADDLIAAVSQKERSHEPIKAI